MTKDKIKMIIICSIFIMFTFSNSFMLAKYRSTITTTSTGTVAKWDNNLVLTSEDSIILDNGEINSETLTFNVTSNSNVSSKYDITINNLPRNVRLDLSNLSNSRTFLFDDDYITVLFGQNQGIFTIPSSSTQTQNSGITMNATVNAGILDITFTSSSNDSSIHAVITNATDEVDLVFNHFGNIQLGTNQSIAHTAVFSTGAVQLPGISELELYATIEQID